MKLLLVFTEIQIKYGSYAFQHGLGSISAYVKRAGHDVALAYMGPRWRPEDFRRRLREFAPDVIGFYTTEDQLRFARKLLAEPGVDECFTVFGGPFATLNPEYLEEEPRLDAICVGEGERPMVDLLDRLARGSDPGDVPGLWVRRGSEIIRNNAPLSSRTSTICRGWIASSSPRRPRSPTSASPRSPTSIRSASAGVVPTAARSVPTNGSGRPRRVVSRGSDPSTR